MMRLFNFNLSLSFKFYWTLVIIIGNYITFLLTRTLGHALSLQLLAKNRTIMGNKTRLKNRRVFPFDAGHRQNIASL